MISLLQSWTWVFLLSISWILASAALEESLDLRSVQAARAESGMCDEADRSQLHSYSNLHDGTVLD